MKSGYIILLILVLFSCSLQDNSPNNEIETKNRDWTIMFYLGADNDLEYDLLRNVRDIKESYQGGCNVIIFIDRSSSYSKNTTIFGENFSGPRIYRVKKNKSLELLKNSEFFSNLQETDNGLIDSANIFVMKKFIEYCKNEFESNHYALIIGSHGGGARNRNLSGKKENIVYDESENNWIYTAQFTEYLNKNHSVDLLGLDACFMGNIEFLYQIRLNNGGFQAEYVAASPPTEWSYGWNYSEIFKRISDNKNSVLNETVNPITEERKRGFSSSSLTPLDLGKIIIEEHYDYTCMETDDQILALYDTSQISELKINLDSLFVCLKDNSSDLKQIRGTDEISQEEALLYFDSSSIDEWIDYCYFDIYDIADKIYLSDKFSNNIKNRAEIVKQSVGNVILYSFAGNYFKRFQNNRNGISFFLPDGDRVYNDKRVWSFQTWYNANSNKNYGNLSFCIDNAQQGNGQVENYFEVLDYWFDYEDENGGYNKYSY